MSVKSSITKALLLALACQSLASQAQAQPAVATSRKEAIHRSLLECYTKLGNGAGVASEYATLIAIKPNDAVLQYNYGYHLLTAGNTAGAIQHYRRATQLDPVNSQYHGALGNLLMQRKDYRGALLEFGRGGEAYRAQYDQVQKYVQQLEQQAQYNNMLKAQNAGRKTGGAATATKKSSDDDDE